MQLIENNVELIRLELSNLFSGASFDKFSYSGIYSMEFTLSKPQYGFEYYMLEIVTGISILKVPDPSTADTFLVDDFLRIWGKVVDRVELGEDLTLRLYFSDWICQIPSAMDDPEGLFDLRWAIHPVGEKDSFSVWVSDEKNIFLRK
jgi:hypothetical protein